ncbi:MAG TPA: putative DNA modification/repair radical SAM protein [Termitinemataceae bacterium]|nr:putative DNA modification/repair radical SAM protein [Termitinemataceae bacterium]HOM24304.1 putative DNA modification/repair radical SAM protein [Termitinemataceae bacterium]HPQ00645.1 putative DNA modification/repair radical SAM protein [Termitinemataceae bacterium]
MSVLAKISKHMYSFIVNLEEKLLILAASAKYDASCATSGSDHGPEGSGSSKKGGLWQRVPVDSPKTGLGHTVPAGICHSWTEDGRCVSLLKVLFSNVCRYDCAYCVNRASADTPRTSFTVDELVRLTIEFYRRNYIEGLFLSSGVFADPDVVMEQLIRVARRLREEEGFGGYIHLKIIPGTTEKFIAEAGRWADRLSANIELPTEKSLSYLAPQKNGKIILQSMDQFHGLFSQFQQDRQRIRQTPRFAPAGQSTQLIVGASPESDRQIISLSDALYRKFGLRRVYYSAYIPVGKNGRGGIIDPRLPDIPGPPLVREHRLYQADWLLRFYKFKAEEIFPEDRDFLDPHLDPKTVWALNHYEVFPIDVQYADYESLLRVPGIGARSARRILEQRRLHSLSFDTLRRLGVVLKRARYFISVAGKRFEQEEDPKRIRYVLSDSDGAGYQLPLFEF